MIREMMYICSMIDQVRIVVSTQGDTYHFEPNADAKIERKINHERVFEMLLCFIWLHFVLFVEV